MVIAFLPQTIRTQPSGSPAELPGILADRQRVLDPREVLRAIPGLVLVEVEHSGPDPWCCGGGGNLQAVDPALVRRIASRRVAEAVSTGADVLVTACPQCTQVLEEAARDSGSNLAVRDLAEVVLEHRLRA